MLYISFIIRVEINEMLSTEKSCPPPVYFIALQCTYLLKQSAIPLLTGRATNGLKVGNFPGRMRGAGSPEPAHSTGNTCVEMTGYVTTAQQIT